MTKQTANFKKEEKMQVSEVEEAKRELREELRWWEAVIIKSEKELTARDANKVIFRAKNLLNALDNIKTEAEPVADNKKETKLPWKDVSERIKKLESKND